jgi:Pilus formation protein N terminal region
MNTLKIVRCIVSAVAVCAGATIACAAQYLEIQNDESQMLSVASAPGAVIVGNPSIADVSIDGNHVFVHGRSYGQTSLLILDSSGNQILNLDLAVKHTQVSNVALFRGTDRFSYSCTPYCEAELQIGDSPDNFKNVSEMVKTKTEIATGSKTAEAKAPAAPQ